MFTVSLYYFALAFLLLVKQDTPVSTHVHEPDRIEEPEHTSSSSSLLTPSVFWQKSKTYFPIALLDVYANYVMIRAFEFTTLTSVTLLDALAIPSALILSKLFLQRHYTTLHFVGVFLCLGGIMVNIAQDYEVDEHQPDSALVQAYPRMMLGDFLGICGGLLVGCSNVVQEISVRKLGGPYEYLGMLGFWATMIAIVHCYIFERNGIVNFFADSEDHDDDGTCSRKTALWILTGYFVANVSIYWGTSQFLQYSEATFYNLSLLTGDVWSVVFSVLAQGIRPYPLFFVALICTVSGVMVYEMAPSPILEERRSLEHGSHVELGQIDLTISYDDHSDGSVGSHEDGLPSDLTLKAVVC
jgi:solute carrier family 35 protein F1/2